MPYISKFKTDEAYGVDDINEIITIITGAGVVPSTPNDILSAAVGSGVTLSDEKCIVTWNDSEKKNITIGNGTVIMPDGSYIMISKETLPIPAGGSGYVFIYNDILLHNIPKCEEECPTDGRNYILLAEISDGQIIDKRVLSVSKIEGYGISVPDEEKFNTSSLLWTGKVTKCDSYITLDEEKVKNCSSVVFYIEGFCKYSYDTFPEFCFNTKAFVPDGSYVKCVNNTESKYFNIIYESDTCFKLEFRVEVGYGQVGYPGYEMKIKYI